MNVTEVKKGIYEVGAVDWNVRNFHGYSTNRGTSYNAYLIIDDKITLIDTVKEMFAGELIARISEIIDPAKIDYIISNHVEPDHSGSLAIIYDMAPNATIVTSDPNGLKGLEAHYGKSFKFMPVKNGDIISIVKRSLSFLLTPMLHWPDSMVTYCPEEKILFSNDAFGQHLASSNKFDDQNDYGIFMHEAKKYYANILMPYGIQAKKAVSALRNFDIEMFATGHGLIVRKYVKELMDMYEYFADSAPEESAVIVYDSMWQSTETIAKAVLEGFKNKGVKVQFCDLKNVHISDIMTDILKAQYIAVGSPTLNNNMLPTVAAFLTYMKGLSPNGKKAFAFGSYGWGGQSVDQINDILSKCKFDIILDPIKVLYRPTKEKLKEIEKLVENI